MFFSKSSSGHVECSFDNPAEFFWFLFEKEIWFFLQSVKVASLL